MHCEIHYFINYINYYITMKHFIKLMLCAALALPGWTNAAAQKDAKPSPKAASQQVVQKTTQRGEVEMKEMSVDVAKKSSATHNHAAPRNNAPSAPGGPNKSRVRNLHYVTLCDGSATNTYVPIYGYYYDNYQSVNAVSQMIYPASMLANAGMTGKTIKSITFYAPDGIKFSTESGDGELTATIARYSNSTTFSGSVIDFSSLASDEATITPKYGDTELTFNFDDGLICSAGYNILIDITVSESGTCDPSNGATQFVGVNQSSNTAYNYCYNSGNSGNRQFLPKIQFGLWDRNSLDNHRLDFGTVQCGSASEVKTATINNYNGTACDLEWEIKGANANKFSTTFDQSVTSVPAGGSITFPITFTPGNMSGDMSAGLHVTMGNTDFAVALHGKGVKDYDASVSPTSLNFGEVLLNDNGTATVTLTNTGLQAFTPLPTTPDNAAFTVASASTGSLASGESRDYVVTFTPTAEQPYASSFYFKDGANKIDLKVNIKGNGVTTAAPYVVEQEEQSGGTEPTITICDGNATQVEVPFYGYYADYGTQGQSIYTNALLGLNPGDQITSITLYSSEILSTSYGGTDYPVKVKLGTTTQTTLSSRVTSGLTQVYSGSIWSGSKSVTFDFSSTPYEYQSGNLLVDLSCFPTSSGGNWKTLNWIGETSSGSSYYYRLNSDRHTVGGEGTIDFLPKMTLTVIRAAQQEPEFVRVEEVAWGNQNAGSFYSKQVTIKNPNSSSVEATLTTTKPFYFAANTSSDSKTVTLPAGTSTQTLYFNPTDATAYTGSLAITVGQSTSNTRLTGVGLKSGQIATRDSAFFASKTYDWTDENGGTHTSNLAEVATDPDQIIAMLTEVYTNKDIPGNWKRGYTTSGGDEPWNDVAYTGVGGITHTGTDYTQGYSYADDYGWNIKGTPVYGGYNSTFGAYYAHLDSTQYKPNQEGLTLLLVEIDDEFDIEDFVRVRDASYANNKAQLRACIENSIKSVRTINASKRTGTGYDAGTLFKLDCDKLNKFYIIAKGQVRYPYNSLRVFNTEGRYYSTATFCRLPCYAYSTGSYYYMGNSSNTSGGFMDYNCYVPLYHMFEQFSPYDLNNMEEVSDVYQAMVNMESYFVPHDCASIPNVSPRGHHFRMYGEISEASDCQDVRDMMFFVPDYRMMKDDDRDTYFTKFLNYNTAHQPKMGLYVIHQDPVEGEKVANKDLYKLTLTWKSNMDEFLPRDEQEYQLYQFVTNEFGDESWVPVYERDNQGRYKTKSGGWLTDTVGHSQELVPVVLTKEALTSATARHNYPDVYIDQETGGKTVTFAVKGQDADHFLTLQMSNEESYFIPGTDATEIMHVTSATYYSRFEPQAVRNCYSNKIEVKTNPNSVRIDYYRNKEFQINRTWYEQVEGQQPVAHTTQVAKAYIVNNDNGLKVEMIGATQSPESMFPKGKSDGDDAERAGYHANDDNNVVPITHYQYNGTWYTDFNFVVWDNFVVDVSKNDHPGQYVYEVVLRANGDYGDWNAHSNAFTVPVHKTASRISAPRTLAQVLGDSQIAPELAPGDVAFDAQVKYSSKQNILRYDAYRWNEGEDRYIINKVYGGDDEQDLPPTGIAGNQGESYTVTMNAEGSSDYYVGDPVAVSTTNSTNWASFVDYYPTNQDTEAGSYVYAPVIELFTKGYKDGTNDKREDYNTYGGPLQNTAVGKLEVTPVTPDAAHPLMSEHSWTGDGTTGHVGEKYSYYNIFLNYNALDVPEGYELYKIRAWRKVDPNILGEELKTRRDVRIDGIDENGWYLYEDMNFGDPLTENGTATMKRDNLFDGEQTVMLLGERSAKIARPQNPDAAGDPEPLFGTETGTWAYGENQEAAIHGEMRATFGARRLDLDDEDNDMTSLEAKFKVRAYFTRKANPLIAGKTDNAPFYAIGNSANSTSWDPATPLGTLYSYDGETYVGNVTVNDTNNGNDAGYGYLSFANKIGSWAEVESGNRFGWYQNDNYWMSEADYGKELTLTSTGSVAPGNFRMPVGTYNMTVKVENGTPTKLVINKGALRAPRRAGEQMTGSDFDYFVAESEEITFTQQGGSGVITGISAVKQDVNREVIGVSYVNTVGQVSSTPWQGVNMVVTRYSDGSTTTRKVVK